MSSEANELARAIIALRETLNLSQSEVARRSKSGGYKGISNGYLSLLESGQVLPETLTVKKINALARGFNIPPQKLFYLVIGKSEKNSTIDELSRYISELPDSRREDLLEIAKVFYEKRSQQNQSDKPHKGWKLRADQSGEEQSDDQEEKKSRAS